MEYGYIKKHYDRRKGQKAQSKSKPFHYVTEDGYDIYVGKNNFQNDELTFKFATGNDWWFHAKKMAGSHVVVKSKDGERPVISLRLRDSLLLIIPKDVLLLRWRLIISKRSR